MLAVTVHRMDHEYIHHKWAMRVFKEGEDRSMQKEGRFLVSHIGFFSSVDMKGSVLLGCIIWNTSGWMRIVQNKVSALTKSL